MQLPEELQGLMGEAHRAYLFRKYGEAEEKVSEKTFFFFFFFFFFAIYFFIHLNNFLLLPKNNSVLQSLKNMSSPQNHTRSPPFSPPLLQTPFNSTLPYPFLSPSASRSYQPRAWWPFPINGVWHNGSSLLS